MLALYLSSHRNIPRLKMFLNEHPWLHFKCKKNLVSQKSQFPVGFGFVNPFGSLLNELNHVIELETDYWNINCNRYGRILISGLIACVQSRSETRYMCSHFVKVSKCESFLAQNCVAVAVFPISSSLFDPFDANKEIDGCRFSLLDGKIYLGIAWMRVEAYSCPCI